MRKLLSIVLMSSLISGCPTQGGWYKKGDPVHGEFSTVNSIGAVLGAAVIVGGAAAASKGGGGSSSYSDTGYAWDYQPGNNQWVCRNRANGQYAYKENCAGQPFVDNWP